MKIISIIHLLLKKFRDENFWGNTSQEHLTEFITSQESRIMPANLMFIHSCNYLLSDKSNGE